MANSTPVITSTGVLIAQQTIAVQATPVRATFNLLGKYKGKLFVGIGRSGTTAIGTSPIELVIRPMHGGSTPTFRSGANPRGRVGNPTTAVSTTCSAASAGDQQITVAATSGFARNDLICIGYNTANQEFARVARVNGSTVLILDAPLLNAHNNSETVTNCADVWDIDLPGGAIYEVILDYNGSSTGPTVCAVVNSQTYDSDLIA